MADINGRKQTAGWNAARRRGGGDVTSLWNRLFAQAKLQRQKTRIKTCATTMRSNMVSGYTVA